MRNTTTYLTGALLGALLLTGCASTPAGEQEAAPASPGAQETDPATETPTVEATPTESAIPAPGERVSEQKRAVAAYQAGFGYYQWPDMTYTIIDPAAPLPDEVLADIMALLPTVKHEPPQPPPPGRTGWAWDLEDRKHSIRKTLVFVAVGSSWGLNNELLHWGWTHAGSNDPAFALPIVNNQPVFYDTHDQALARAQEIIASQPNPGLYELFDLGAAS
ncbi:hypothetical protein [Actinotalea sp. K2]|uniref:hypothetical protein n=1 Tax=Actinotalea sp. K2 TaxID=2939438 RepID=UPI0020182F29|nr:hypothetical protein [Actinotalea sp. K2]MCL3862961.1 hypothetical protein [Actinotalea sp. K2]